jgi:hypothetical protein
MAFHHPLTAVLVDVLDSRAPKRRFRPPDLAPIWLKSLAPNVAIKIALTTQLANSRRCTFSNVVAMKKQGNTNYLRC